MRADERTDVRWETSASVSEAQRIAVRLMSEANARAMPWACINVCLVRNPEP